MQEIQVQSLAQEDPLEKEIPVFLPGESHEQRSLAGYSLWGCKELDMTERLNSSNICRKQGRVSCSFFGKKQPGQRENTV